MCFIEYILFIWFYLFIFKRTIFSCQELFIRNSHKIQIYFILVTFTQNKKSKHFLSFTRPIPKKTDFFSQMNFCIDEFIYTISIGMKTKSNFEACTTNQLFIIRVAYLFLLLLFFSKLTLIIDG